MKLIIDIPEDVLRIINLVKAGKAVDDGAQFERDILVEFISQYIVIPPEIC